MNQPQEHHQSCCSTRSHNLHWKTQNQSSCQCIQILSTRVGKAKKLKQAVTCPLNCVCFAIQVHKTQCFMWCQAVWAQWLECYYLKVKVCWFSRSKQCVFASVVWEIHFLIFFGNETLSLQSVQEDNLFFCINKLLALQCTKEQQELRALDKHSFASLPLLQVGPCELHWKCTRGPLTASQAQVMFCTEFLVYSNNLDHSPC